MLEIVLAGYNSAQQNGGIDRRYFRFPNSLTGIYIRPVIEKPSVVGQLLPEKTKRGQRTFSRRRKRNPATLLTDAESCQAEPCSRQAGYNALIIRLDIESILLQTSLWVSMFPEILEVSIFQIIKEFVVLLRESRKQSWVFLRHSVRRCGGEK